MSITNQKGYTPMGFKTKAVLETIEPIKNINTCDKINTLKDLNLMGELICSDRFQGFSINEKRSLLTDFADLKKLIDSFI